MVSSHDIRYFHGFWAPGTQLFLSFMVSNDFCCTDFIVCSLCQILVSLLLSLHHCASTFILRSIKARQVYSYSTFQVLYIKHSKKQPKVYNYIKGDHKNTSKRAEFQSSIDKQRRCKPLKTN